MHANAEHSPAFVTPCGIELPPDAAEHALRTMVAAVRRTANPHHVQRRCTVFASLRSGGFRTLSSSNDAKRTCCHACSNSKPSVDFTQRVAFFIAFISCDACPMITKSSA